MSKHAGFLISLMALTGCLGGDMAGSREGNDFGQRFVGNPESESLITEERLSANRRAQLEAAIADSFWVDEFELHGVVVTRQTDRDPFWAGEMDTLFACGWLTITEWEPALVGGPPRPAPAGPFPFVSGTGFGSLEFDSVTVYVEEQTLQQSVTDECREAGIHIWGTPG